MDLPVYRTLSPASDFWLNLVMTAGTGFSILTIEFRTIISKTYIFRSDHSASDMATIVSQKSAEGVRHWDGFPSIMDPETNKQFQVRFGDDCRNRLQHIDDRI